MGAWGSAPWHNDAAADWFGDVFAGIDIDAHITDAFQYDDDYDRVRAACYLLAVLGHSAVWPGELEQLDDHLERGIELLNDMVEPGSDFRELWEDDSEVVLAVRPEIAELEARLDGDFDDEDDDDEDEGDDDDEDAEDLDDDDEEIDDDE
uniref:hypothetical protein n=1 Tax=Leucobacter sp. BZR 635 TaxID=3378705 RepID=UPI003A85D559